MTNTIPAAVGITVRAAGDVNLSGAWDTLWGAIQGAIGSGIGLALTIIGLCLVLAAVLKWIFDRRRAGGTGQTSPMWWAIFIGAILAAPGAVIPILLTIVDALANAAVNLFNAVF
ncbi:hypothetical protein [Agromyces subbeticus]|uniref:hypothetical protein n=1 Tax=Agromyces subbeticus TaxID=293890 RepID=UPI0003B55058|nr:hypothetical protein [Agromyces subbeticus]